MPKPDPWIQNVEVKIRAFAGRHSLVYRKTAREVSAAFEIGCFHALTEFYDDSCQLTNYGSRCGSYLTCTAISRSHQTWW
jgi:hypothetical protein